VFEAGISTEDGFVSVAYADPGVGCAVPAVIRFTG
jgi:hypothetical protein